MIYLENLKFKNFLSYSNTLTEYKFNQGITRLNGLNGQGKSVLLDVINYAFFGKPYRKVKINQLINSINNKDLYVELVFRDEKDNSYKIVRGIKPNIFEIYKNDVIIPVLSHNKSYQQMLEEDIIYIDENIFNQIVAKSLTKNISFLSLSKYDKRKIIESILNIEIFSYMKIHCKNIQNDIIDKNKSITSDINNYKLLISQELSNIENLRNIQKQIEQNRKKQDDEIDSEIENIKKINEQIEIGFQKINEYKILKEELTKNKELIDKELKTIKKEYKELEITIKVSEERLSIFKEKCLGCVKLNDIEKHENIQENKDMLDSLVKKYEELTNKNKVFVETEIKYDKILNNESKLQYQKEKNQQDLIKLQSKKNHNNEDNVIFIDESNLKKYKEILSNREKESNQIQKIKSHYEIVYNLLNDDGIKTFVINKYLPYINKLLNTYLLKFSADILFYFDSEFNEIVASKNKENFSYYSFSEGQKRRIDLAILFTFMEFCKIKNKKSQMNILILDEVTAGLDSVGENALYDILREMVAKDKIEVITITHSAVIDSDKVDRAFRIVQEKGFSKMIEELK